MGSKVVAIVGARLNSSRLPRKQLLPLAGKPLISHVFERLSKVASIDEAVLATTADFYNKDLSEWAKSSGVSCFEYEGDVDDLMGRVDHVVRSTDADIVVYVCGDSPLIEPSTISTLIKKLKADPEADWARMKELPEGETYIHEGFAVYRRSFWDKMVEASVEPFEREHVGAVFHALNKVKPEHTGYAEEDPIYHSINHRVSVDTSSDYEFMRRIYEDWFEQNDETQIVDLKWVIGRLHNEPELLAINSHVRQKKVAEENLTVRIITQTGSRAGLGHLRRMVIAAQQVQEQLSAAVCIDIWGNAISFDWLAKIPHKWINQSAEKVLENCECGEVVLIDLPDFSDELLEAVKAARSRGVTIVAIDYVSEDDCFDAYYIPCFYISPETEAGLDSKLFYGWDSYLLPKVPPYTPQHDQPRKVIIMSGGGDYYGVGETWPLLLDRALPKDIEFTWVQGPFAEAPDLEGISKTRTVTIANSPSDLPSLVAKSDIALNVYGITLFECLKIGIPTVTYVPDGAVESREIEALLAEDACFVAHSAEDAVQLLMQLCEQPDRRQRYTAQCNSLFQDKKGAPPLVEMIEQLCSFER